MPLIQVTRFHDHDRTLQEFWVDPAEVAAIGPKVTQWSEQGGTVTRQVWLHNGKWFFLGDDDGTLVPRLRG